MMATGDFWASFSINSSILILHEGVWGLFEGGIKAKIAKKVKLKSPVFSILPRFLAYFNISLFRNHWVGGSPSVVLWFHL